MLLWADVVLNTKPLKPHLSTHARMHYRANKWNSTPTIYRLPFWGKCIKRWQLLRNFGRPGFRNIYSRVLHQVLWDKLFCGDGSYVAASAKTKTTARKPSNETYLTYIETFKIQPTSSEARTISMLPLLRKDLYVITFFPISATLLLPSVQIRFGDNKFRPDYWSKIKTKYRIRSLQVVVVLFSKIVQCMLRSIVSRMLRTAKDRHNFRLLETWLVSDW